MSTGGLTVVFQNDRFLAIDKPSGIASIPERTPTGESARERLSRKYPEILTVHRIDRDTSGLLLFARTEDAHRFLSRCFEERKMEKRYVGVVVGKPHAETGCVEAPLAEHPTRKGSMTVHPKGKASLTEYRILDAHATYSLVEFRPVTGRTHQIRVHAAHIGHPLACDPLYGNGKPVYLSSVKKKYRISKAQDEERPMIQRLALHAHTLRFTDEQGDLVELTAPIPKEFQALMRQLKKQNPA